MKQWYANILDECSRIASERGESYWPVEENFKNIAAIHRENFGVEITPVEIAEVMISIKIARQKNKHKDDNIIDVINYFAILLYLKNL